MRNTFLILSFIFFLACKSYDESKKEYGELASEVQAEIDTTIDVGGNIPRAIPEKAWEILCQRWCSMDP